MQRGTRYLWTSAASLLVALVALAGAGCGSVGGAQEQISAAPDGLASLGVVYYVEGVDEAGQPTFELLDSGRRPLGRATFVAFDEGMQCQGEWKGEAFRVMSMETRIILQYGAESAQIELQRSMHTGEEAAATESAAPAEALLEVYGLALALEPLTVEGRVAAGSGFPSCEGKTCSKKFVACGHGGCGGICLAKQRLKCSESLVQIKCRDCVWRQWYYKSPFGGGSWEWTYVAELCCGCSIGALC